MDPDELAFLLADRLSRIMPPGFHVVAADGMLWYSADEGRFPGQLGNYQVGRAGSYVRANFNVYGHTINDHIVGVAEQALDELQDFIDEATHDPWPGDRTPPRPYAEIRGETVILGYGTPDAPVLECDPIPLDGI